MDRALSRNVAPGPGWLPAWASPVSDGMDVEWCYAGQHRLSEPFFQDSINRLLRNPVNHLLRHRAGMEALAARHRSNPGLRPNGFVFHSSRCGSTLVSQMLGAVAGSVVLAEPQPLDAVLGAIDPRTGTFDKRRAEWLEWMLSALGHSRREGDRFLFVKFDAWHVSQWALLRQVFPEVPWVYVYRDPREVLASHLRQPGAFLLPRSAGGTAISALAEVEGTRLAQRVVAHLRHGYAAALDALRLGQGLLVNYSDLPGAVFERVCSHFGLLPTAADRELMDSVTARDAKTPALPFEMGAKPTVSVAAEDEALLDGSLWSLYAQLEREGSSVG